MQISCKALAGPVTASLYLQDCSTKIVQEGSPSPSKAMTAEEGGVMTSFLEKLLEAGSESTVGNATGSTVGKCR